MNFCSAIGIWERKYLMVKYRDKDLHGIIVLELALSILFSDIFECYILSVILERYYQLKWTNKKFKF